jgi:hypothetical protein
MPKRFTDTDKWKKPFIKSLPTEYKLFWLFLLDECDHSGVWHVELDIAEARLGIKLSIEKIRGFFKERIVEFDGGSKLFIPDFVRYQYGSLNEANKAHRAVVNNIKRYKLEEYVSPLQGAKDKEQDKDKDIERGVIYTIEHCAVLALQDTRWVKSNKADEKGLMEFNVVLEKQGVYTKNPWDYKTHYANWRKHNKQEKGKIDYVAALDKLKDSTPGS